MQVHLIASEAEALVPLLESLGCRVEAHPARDGGAGASETPGRVCLDIHAPEGPGGEAGTTPALLSHLCENIGQGVIFLDHSGSVLLANPAALRILGAGETHPDNRHLAEPLWQALWEDGLPTAPEDHPVWVAAHTGRSVRGVLLGIGMLGTGERRWIRIDAVPGARSATGAECLLVILRDVTESRWRMESVRRSVEELTAMLERSPLIIFIIAANGCITHANAPAEAFCRRPRSGLTGRFLGEVLGCQNAAFADSDWLASTACRSCFVMSAVRHTLETGEGVQKLEGALFLLRESRHETRQLLLTTATIPSGGSSGVLVCLEDVTDRRRTAVQLKSALRDKEALLSEVHHRVKNNLQIITSLLNMQLRRQPDRQVQEALQEAQARITAMSLVHEQLYQAAPMAEIPIDRYVTGLARALAQSHSAEGRGIRMMVRVPSELFIGLDQATPFGLALSELIINAFKHAFPRGRSGVVSVTAREAEGNGMEVVVADDGVGLPAEVDWREADTIGLSLVRGLLERQMGGTLIVRRAEKGTEVTLRFVP